MVKYRLEETAEFKQEFKRLPKERKRRFRKQFKKIKEDPFAVGKPLGKKWLRELKNKGFRAYFVIYKELNIVKLFEISDKKDQKRKIEKIKRLLFQFISILIQKNI